MKVYRITVNSWPTDDGRPWPRFIAGPGSSYSITDPDDPGYRAVWDDLPWFERLADPDTSEVQDVIDAEFGVGDDQAGDIIGWVLPNASRRHYLSAGAAQTWVRKARLLGAVVELEAGEVTGWESVS